jgi:hypothetical protein
VKVGDLVIHNDKQVGIIIHLCEGAYGSLDDSVDADVLFEDGEFQVDSVNLEVISESR